MLEVSIFRLTHERHSWRLHVETAFFNVRTASIVVRRESRRHLWRRGGLRFKNHLRRPQHGLAARYRPSDAACLRERHHRPSFNKQVDVSRTTSLRPQTASIIFHRRLRPYRSWKTATASAVSSAVTMPFGEIWLYALPTIAGVLGMTRMIFVASGMAGKAFQQRHGRRRWK